MSSYDEIELNGAKLLQNNIKVINKREKIIITKK